MPRGESLPEEVERGHEAEIVEDGGAQLVGQPPELVLDAVEEALHLLQALGDVGRHVSRNVVDGEVHGREQLPRLVVELVRDAPGLLLQVVVQASERRVRLADRAMRHLERREALERELARLAHQLDAVVRPPEARDEERLVQHRRHVQHAEARGQRAPPELVRGEQRRLAALREMALQRARELFLQVRHRDAHSSGPRYRTIMTRASSVPLP